MCVGAAWVASTQWQVVPNTVRDDSNAVTQHVPDETSHNTAETMSEMI